MSAAIASIIGYFLPSIIIAPLAVGSQDGAAFALLALDLSQRTRVSVSENNKGRVRKESRIKSED